MKKKLIIAACIAAAVLVIAFVVILILGKTVRIDVDDPDSLYEYSMTQRDNTVTLKINGEFPEGYLWTFDDENTGIVTVTEKKNTKKKAEYEIAAANTGSAVLTFGLQKDDVLPDRTYELTVAVKVDTDNVLSVMGSTHKELSGFKLNGDGTAHHYGFTQNSDGSLMLYASEAPEEGFTLLIEGDTCVTVSTTANEDNAFRYTISPLQTGECILRVCDRSTNTAIELSLRTDEKGSITVTDHKVADFECPDVDPKNIKPDVETLLGKITLPDGATAEKGNVRVLYDDKDNRYFVGWLDFKQGETAWRYFTAKEGPVEVFYNFYQADREKVEEVKVGESTGYYCKTATKAFVTWKNADGNLFALSTTDLNADVIAMAKTLFAANPKSNVTVEEEELPTVE